MTPLTAHAKIFPIGELQPCEQLLEHLQRSSLMGLHFGTGYVGTQSHHLHHERTDIDADPGH